MAEARLERRLAAIMAADVVGYSRLMERDEPGTFARLKRLRRELIEPVLARHSGRLVDLKGDGGIVEFGSAVKAVEAAVEIQRAMLDQDMELPEDRRIRYRIGINLGDVIVEGRIIYGDGINVAARIESLCEPGGVWLSRSVYNQVRGKLDVAYQAAEAHHGCQRSNRQGDPKESQQDTHLVDPEFLPGFHQRGHEAGHALTPAVSASASGVSTPVSSR